MCVGMWCVCVCVCVVWFVCTLVFWLITQFDTNSVFGSIGSPGEEEVIVIWQGHGFVSKPLDNLAVLVVSMDTCVQTYPGLKTKELLDSYQCVCLSLWRCFRKQQNGVLQHF